VTLDCADDTLVGLTVPEHEEPAVGATVTAAPAPGRLLLYDGETKELLGEARVTT
jgi:multiple sugar transport system ATP-binding protein